MFCFPVYSNTVISGNVGEDVILPCIVEYTEEFSYNTVFIRWKTKDFYVLHFFYGHFHEDRQNKIFKGRTQLFYTELPKGNLSLILNNIQNSDAGIYECLVFISKDMYKIKTELVVQGKKHILDTLCLLRFVSTPNRQNPCLADHSNFCASMITFVFYSVAHAILVNQLFHKHIFSTVL